MVAGLLDPGAKPGRRLAELKQIVQEVDSAPDLESALRVLVRRTREFMRVDVCTVYFTDQGERRHVVAATDGLSSRVIGNLTFGFGKGLIGRVAESRRSLNLEQIPPELDQEFLRQTGVEPYQSFLGVPVVHKTQVLGVLLVRQRKSRRFEDADEALLTTLAAQLGGAIAYAQASGEWCRVCHTEDEVARRIEGLAGAPGLAIGQGLVLISASEIERMPARVVEDSQAEEARFTSAIQEVSDEMKTLNRGLAGTLPEADRALFGAYEMLLNSPEILHDVIDGIRQGNWAPGSVSHAFETYAARFDSMQDAYLRERAADVRALAGRIVARLMGQSDRVVVGPEPTVLIGQQLNAIDIGQARQGNLVGIISGDGSPLSHASILARALGIPAVVGLSGRPLVHLGGQQLVVDGTAGLVHLQPNPTMQQAFKQSITNQQNLSEALESVRGLETVTADGIEVALFINAGLSIDLEMAAAVGSAGIGLFRSELPFMLFDRLPSEQEQQRLYHQALQAMHPLPVTLRTLDVGGDKALPYLTGAEASSALGRRGIRFSLDQPEIFLTQLRAAMRADLGLGNLRLLLPMITGLDDLEQAHELIEQAQQQLLDEGLPVMRPPVGVMIEVPAAVYQVESLAREADFLSVGSNDLTQYLLAMDRNNPQEFGRLDPVHPALLQALQQVVVSAKRAAKPVTLCGEIASDPAIALLLLGMGVDGLSMNSSALPTVKWAVRSTTSERMRLLAEQALRCDRPQAIRRLLDVMYGEIGFERLAAHAHSNGTGDVGPHQSLPTAVR